MLKKTLGIFSPNQNAYSETFIQAHKNLPFHIKYYYNGFLPGSLEGKGNIISRSKITRIRNRFNKNFNISEQSLINSLLKEKVDCILAEYGPTAVNSLNVIKYLKLPLIVHFFGYDASIKIILQQYGEKYKHVFAYAKYIVVVSNQMRQTLISLGCPSNKIILTYCGPDDFFFSAKPHYSNANFLAVGRFVDKKAPYLTIAAFKEVARKFPEARLIMVGDGDLLNTCKNLTRLWNIEKYVEFAGIKKPSEIFKLFEDTLAFVQHSITANNGDCEGTPVAILDAQAACLPVISTFHAGIGDVIINNETGLLVEEQDVAGMSHKMLLMLKEQGMAKKFGEAGRKRVKENFSMEIHLKALEKIIIDVTAKNSLN